MNSTEFGIMEVECHFCKQFPIVRFAEHYCFCPNCSAIYTKMIIHSKRCNHVMKNKTPVAIREPWFKSVRQESTYLIALAEPEDGFTHMCSQCHARVKADGW